MLPQLASPETSQGNCAIARKSYVHVKCFVNVNSYDLVHLILKDVKQREGEVIFDLLGFFLQLGLLINGCVSSFIDVRSITLVAVSLVVVDHAICVASYQVLVILREFDASYSGIVSPYFTDQVFGIFIAQIKYLDRVVKIPTDI